MWANPWGNTKQQTESILTGFALSVHNMQCFHLIREVTSIILNKQEEALILIWFLVLSLLVWWNPAHLLVVWLQWQIKSMGSSFPISSDTVRFFVIYCMSLFPGYREIVMQSLPQISALDDLDRLGNLSHQGLMSPSDVPGLEDYVDLLLSSDTSHTEAVIFIYSFYSIFLNNSDIWIVDVLSF